MSNDQSSMTSDTCGEGHDSALVYVWPPAWRRFLGPKHGHDGRLTSRRLATKLIVGNHGPLAIELHGALVAALLVLARPVGQQRVARDVAHLPELGELVEAAPTPELFAMPKDKRTEDYLTGRFG